MAPQVQQGEEDRLGSEARAGFAIAGQTFPAPPLEPGLYLVATPIGNLADMTLRGLKVLAAAGVIACEDTRTTSRLLDRYAITNRMLSYNEHNDERVRPRLIGQLKQGGSVALVSDAGTPLVSDPGQRLVEAARGEGVPVIPVPGPSAPLAALVASGLPGAPFAFAGFLPARSGQRRSEAGRFAGFPGTVIFFESPNRLAASLADLAAVFGDECRATIARELTKIHEEFRTGPLHELAAHYKGHPARGEIVILVDAGGREQEKADPRALIEELLTRMPVSQAAAEAARLTGAPRRELYQLALSLRPAKPGSATPRNGSKDGR